MSENGNGKCVMNENGRNKKVERGGKKGWKKKR